MSTNLKPGTLILSNLSMFNESVVFFENIIQPALFRAIDNKCKQFCKNNGWHGVFAFNDSEQLWFAPNEWIIETKSKRQKKDDIGCKASLYLHIKSDIDFYTAQLCNEGSSDGGAEFRFCLESAYFSNGTNIKKIYENVRFEADKIINSLISEYQLKLVPNAIAEFYLPLILNSKDIASAWDKSNIEDDPSVDLSVEECFEPISVVLEKFNSAIELLYKLVEVFENEKNKFA